MGLVFETLTEIAADGTLRGELATAWTASDDAQIWTFDLRKNVSFHDGVSFTPQMWSIACAELGDVRAVSAHRVQITLEQPDPALPFRLSNPRHRSCCACT